MPAHPLPPTLTTECHPYIYSGSGICSDLLGDHLIYGPESKQERMEKLLANFEFARAYLLAKDDMSDKCLRAVELIYCNHNFQRCDNTSSRIRPRPVCREACEIMVQQHCRVEYPRAREINKMSQGRSDYGYFDLINCTILPKRDGGTIPECYFPQEFKGMISKFNAKHVEKNRWLSVDFNQWEHGLVGLGKVMRVELWKPYPREGFWWSRYSTVHSCSTTKIDYFYLFSYFRE